MINGSNFVLKTVKDKNFDSLYDILCNVSNKGNYWPKEIPSYINLKKDFQQNGLWSKDNGWLLIIPGNQILDSIDREINNRIQGNHQELVQNVSSERIIGLMRFFKSVPYFNALEIAYILFEEKFKRKGIISEALKLLVSYLINTTQINRFELRIDKDNIASQRVAEKNGFVFEGLCRKSNFINGKHVDMKLYSLLREEFK